MKKRLLVLLFAGILALSGCRTKKEAEKAKLAEALENMGEEHSEVLKAVLSKEWNEADSGDTYVFTKEGTGEISGESFTYICGFNEENRMLLQMIMDGTKEERNYYVTTDDTGYGLHLDTAGDDDLYLIQADMELLGEEDERAAGIPGEWADKSDNRYILKEDRAVVIKNKSGGETEGTYSLAERKDDEMLILTLVFGGNTLDFHYELSQDGQTLTLSTPEASHEWTKVS